MFLDLLTGVGFDTRDVEQEVITAEGKYLDWKDEFKEEEQADDADVAYKSLVIQGARIYEDVFDGEEPRHVYLNEPVLPGIRLKQATDAAKTSTRR